jgi:hypothetical protein
MLHDYQQKRILTLIDPTTDPLGSGYHIIQSTIAIGSGGAVGKGFLNGTQTHLEFIPEKHTDFIFAVYSEEWGLLGNATLVFLYTLLIGRGLMIASARRPPSPPAGRRHHARLLHLRLHQHGHGQRHPARRRRAAPFMSLAARRWSPCSWASAC